MPQLRYRRDGTFTIAQITDTHIARRHPDADEQTYDLISRVITLEQPDVVVLTGDIVHPADEETWQPLWSRFIRFMDETDVPWAFVFGNHDAEKIPYEWIESAILASERGIYERGPGDVWGHGNYVVPVLGSRGDRHEAFLWSLDSGMGSSEPSGYDWIKPNQLEWFSSEHDRLVEDEQSSLVFFHIPLVEYERGWQELTAKGFMNEKVCYQGRDIGQMDVFRGRAHGCFVGHEHVNDYEVEWDGVMLCYGRGTGYGGYGRDGFQRGARIITLREGVPGFDTHVRLHDGSLAERPLHQPDGMSM